MRRLLAACVVSVVALSGASVRASSVAATSIGFEAAVARAGRIVVGRVMGTAPAVIDGKRFASVSIALERALKGPAARAGETARVFDPGEWYQHTHAAAIKAGVVSYEDPRYATPVPAAELKKGATFVFFLRADAPPAGFPTGAAFALCTGAVERADRAKDVTALKLVPFDSPFKLKVGERALLPDGLALELRGHAHKHQMVDGPSKAMSEVQVTLGARSELVSLGHVVYAGSADARATEEWETRDWLRYRLDLVGMSYDVDSTLRVRLR